MSLLSGLRLGTGLASTPVPPTFNVPKSQLQMFAESMAVTGRDLLGACAAGDTPLARMIAVARWHIATVRPYPFGKAPYNPVLGETHHMAVGDTQVIAEQVSHNPPISACRGRGCADHYRLLVAPTDSKIKRSDVGF